jgi:hypothetical protein
MRKIVAILGLGALLMSMVPAQADYRDRRHYQPRPAPVYRHAAPAPRYYAPRPVYHAPRRNWVPYAVGGAVLGAMGAYFYNQYGQVCQNVIVGQGWNGYRYVPVTETVCD